MSKRPHSITVIGCLFVAAGVVGFAYHVTELKIQGQFEYGVVWVCLLRLLAILGGVFVLRANNWARWLLLSWMTYHVVLSALHSMVELFMHSVLLAVVIFVLFRPPAAAYFRNDFRAVE